MRRISGQTFSKHVRQLTFALKSESDLLNAVINYRFSRNLSFNAKMVGRFGVRLQYAMFMGAICTRVQVCSPGENLHPGCHDF